MEIPKILENILPRIHQHLASFFSCIDFVQVLMSTIKHKFSLFSITKRAIVFNNTVTSRCGVDKRGDNFFAGFLTMLNLCEYFGEYLDRFTAWISDLVSAIQFVNNVVVLWKLATTITCTNSSPVLGQFIVILLIMKITQQ